MLECYPLIKTYLEGFLSLSCMFEKYFNHPWQLLSYSKCLVEPSAGFETQLDKKWGRQQYEHLQFDLQFRVSLWAELGGINSKNGCFWVKTTIFHSDI